MGSSTNQMAASSEETAARSAATQQPERFDTAQQLELQNQKQHEADKDRTVESFVYLYFLVSVGFIMSVMYFVSPQMPAYPKHQHEINLDIFCAFCIFISILWMSFMLLRQQTSSVVQFTDFPKRYTRPLLIAIYLFGISCIVTDTITLWILIGCIKTMYFRFALTSLKLLFSIFLMLFLRKYSSAVLFGVNIPVFHVLGTCICLMLRTALGNSRPLLPKTFWVESSECGNLFINPAMADEDQYIIAFDQEFYITVIVVLLIIWTNIKPCPKPPTKPLHFTYHVIDEQVDLSLDTSLETEPSRDYNHSQSISEAIQKEPNIDMGLVFGLTIGAILSIPYTFWWEKSFLTDKRIELFSFHLMFIISMLLATLLSSIKLRNFPIPRISGISFPVTVLLFVLLFCCTWYSWFSILASGIEMKREHFTRLVTLAFSDHCLFFVQVVFQGYLIVKAYSYCQVVLKPNSSNTVRQCILFLMVCNFVLWIHVVYFDLNHKDKTELQISFYGGKLWNMISKSTYPLCMYYRLFSSLCLFEICFLF